MYVLAAFILGILVSVIYDLFAAFIFDFFRSRWRKECNYDCSTCCVWDCGKHSCDRQRNREMKRKKEID